jgi:diguanylate cyclase (GGDEF)-like protein
MLVTDGEFRIVAANAAFARLTGQDLDSLAGQRLDAFDDTLHHAASVRLGETGAWRGEVWGRRPGESRFLAAASASRIRDGEAPLYLWVLHDLVKADSEEDAVLGRDPLTRLPNRLLLIDRLQRVCERCRRAGTKAALLLVELDGLRGVNESFGQDVGDRLLVQVADRLRETIRQSDTAARLDADEFAVILNEIGNDKDAQLVARHILERLGEEFLIEGRSIYVSGSVGVTVMPSDGCAWTRLIRSADVALSVAKRAGRSAIRFFTPELDAEVSRRSETEMELRAALQRGEFRLYYQPVIDVGRQHLVAAEALLRWQHPVRGLIGADAFIEVAEETGLITDIGQWVLSEVIETLARWSHDGVPPCRIAVNVADRQLRNPVSFEEPLAQLARAGLPPSLIEAEVSEAILRDKMPSVARSFAMLSEAGIGLVIDDFDTGYTTLRLLKRFPVKSLRIDRIFVRDIDAEENAAVVAAMIALANSLGVPIVGKGVESERQRDWLRDHGCQWVQGFLTSKPVDETEMREILLRMSTVPV